jgi:hypothetical protein
MIQSWYQHCGDGDAKEPHNFPSWSRCRIRMKMFECWNFALYNLYKNGRSQSWSHIIFRPLACSYSVSSKKNWSRSCLRQYCKQFWLENLIPRQPNAISNLKSDSANFEIIGEINSNKLYYTRSWVLVWNELLFGHARSNRPDLKVPII